MNHKMSNSNIASSLGSSSSSSSSSSHGGGRVKEHSYLKIGKYLGYSDFEKKKPSRPIDRKNAITLSPLSYSKKKK